MTYRNVPGVFIEEVPALPPSVAGVATGIPAFIGYTQKITTPNGDDLINKPTRITSLLDYQLLFGGAEQENDIVVTVRRYLDKDNNVLREIFLVGFEEGEGKGPSKHNMYYALQLYFANGGGPCYIVSVGSCSNPETGIARTISKTDLSAGLLALAGEDEPTMIVFPEAIHLVSKNGDAYNYADYIGIYNEALTQAADLKDRFVIIDVFQSERGVNIDINGDNTKKGFRDETTSLLVDYRMFGAAYYPYLLSTYDYFYTETDENLIKVITVDIKESVQGEPVTKKLSELKNTSDNNARYNLIKDKIGQLPITLPPSPAIAAIYARVDNERGVWKAPANVGVAGIAAPALKVKDSDQEFMNIHSSGLSVNAIRSITGRGTVVWGARTLDSNSNEWRYVNVRRFFNFVEESVKKATYPFVFEPNDANTWVRVRAMIENFLTLQWRAGALQGTKPEQAFFVRVGLGQTMTATDIYEGRMIVEIGMAVVRPAEFIFLRFSHKMVEA